MSALTLLQYIAQLPAEPVPGRALYRVAYDRVVGRHGALDLSSAFLPVFDRNGPLVGHEAFVRASGPQGALPARELFQAARDDEALVRLDRLCRTVHALNWFAGAQDGTWLFLNVDARLLRIVPEEHGTTFRSVLSSFGVLASRVVISLPVAAAADPGLLEDVLPSYRLRGFRVLVEVTGWPATEASRIERLRPDVVRVRWDEAGRWTGAAGRIGARLLATRIETPAQGEVALDAGASLLQGHGLGAERASTSPIVSLVGI